MKKGIILAAYGATNPEGKIGLESFERRCRQAFPGLPIRWAFTSPFQRDRLARQKRKSDSIAKALMRCHFEHFNEIAIQPLQIIPGREHAAMLETIEKVKAQTDMACKVGAPLINNESQIPQIAQGLAAYAMEITGDNSDVVFMAHGATHASGALFAALSKEMELLGKGLFLATMVNAPLLDDVLPRLSTKKVWLVPMLAVAGIHALRDMAGDSSKSWKTRIEKAGHQCEPVLHGLIESDYFANRWLGGLTGLLSPAASHDS